MKSNPRVFLDKTWNVASGDGYRITRLFNTITVTASEGDKFTVLEVGDFLTMKQAVSLLAAHEVTVGNGRDKP